MKRYVKSAIMPVSNYNWRDLLEIAQDENTSVEILNEIAATTTASSVQHTIIANPNVTSEVLDTLTNAVLNDHTGVDADICNRLARNEKLSKQSLQALLDYFLAVDESFDSDEVLESIAENPNATVRMLQKLSNCSEYSIRAAVARNNNTSMATLSHLAKVDSFITPFILSNPNVSMELLYKLSTSNDDNNREYIAGNPSTPEDLLINLSKDKNYRVRAEVAGNKSTPIEVLKELAKDHEWIVYTLAKQTLQELGAL